MQQAVEKAITQWGNRYECTTGEMGGLPDVNTENPGFQDYFVKYLNELVKDGCDGMRYDTAKHIGVPSDPKDEYTSQKGWTNNFWPLVSSMVRYCREIMSLRTSTRDICR